MAMKYFIAASDNPEAPGGIVHSGKIILVDRKGQAVMVSFFRRFGDRVRKTEAPFRTASAALVPCLVHLLLPNPRLEFRTKLLLDLPVHRIAVFLFGSAGVVG